MRLFINAHHPVPTTWIAWTGDPAGLDAIIDRGASCRIRRVGRLSTLARWRRGDLWVDLHHLEAKLSTTPDAPDDWEANFVDMIEQAESDGHLDIEKMLLRVRYRLHDVPKLAPRKTSNPKYNKQQHYSKFTNLQWRTNTEIIHTTM